MTRKPHDEDKPAPMLDHSPARKPGKFTDIREELACATEEELMHYFDKERDEVEDMTSKEKLDWLVHQVGVLNARQNGILKAMKGKVDRVENDIDRGIIGQPASVPTWLDNVTPEPKPYVSNDGVLRNPPQWPLPPEHYAKQPESVVLGWVNVYRDGDARYQSSAIVYATEAEARDPRRSNETGLSYIATIPITYTPKEET